MSEMRSLTNLVGNGVATIVVAKWEGEFDAAQASRMLDGEVWLDNESEAVCECMRQGRPLCFLCRAAADSRVFHGTPREDEKTAELTSFRRAALSQSNFFRCLVLDAQEQSPFSIANFAFILAAEEE